MLGLIMSDLDKMQKRIVAFRDARDWKQFHNPKDMAISLVLEASEVIEHFQWKTQEEAETYLKSHKGEVADELVDVMYWVLLMAHDLDIDIAESFDNKMAQNEAKYSVEKSKGNHKKYTEHNT
jgi:NTP pyrophosphatase (non-canonical NTP hydrolase)